MDMALFVQDVASGVLSTVIATLIISGIAWLVWPFRWRLQGRAIQRMIADQRRFKFVFNPEAKAHKVACCRFG
ncbi:MAG: hypothetical protein LPJ91_01400 [Pseudazoarcus pumilus]|nr:hypothetical protein [Pseudazoarcus pumilus]